MIYDLGGGTLDVSVVRIEGEVTEVLASHGNNHLGGDDFDQKLVDHLLEEFRKQHNIDLRDKHPAAYARLWWAAEAAKKQLSFEPFARVVEESLIQVDGRPLHLDVEISREKYEEMIRPLLDQTLDSASKALSDAGLLPQAAGRGPAGRRVHSNAAGPESAGKDMREGAPSGPCIRTCAWHWAPAFWRAGSAGTRWSACWWMSPRTPSGPAIWA